MRLMMRLIMVTLPFFYITPVEAKDAGTPAEPPTYYFANKTNSEVLTVKSAQGMPRGRISNLAHLAYLKHCQTKKKQYASVTKFDLTPKGKLPPGAKVFQVLVEFSCQEGDAKKISRQKIILDAICQQAQMTGDEELHKKCREFSAP